MDDGIVGQLVLFDLIPDPIVVQRIIGTILRFWLFILFRGQGVDLVYGAGFDINAVVKILLLIINRDAVWLDIRQDLFLFIEFTLYRL